MAAVFPDAERSELLRLVGALKTVIRHAVTLRADAATLHGLANRAESLAAALGPLSGTRPFPPYSTDPTYLPFSAVMGPYNPVAPDVAIRIEADEARAASGVQHAKRAVAEVRFSNVYEGPPTYVHGGWIAAMYDQVLAFANRANGFGGLTASISCRYKKPTPLETPLRFEAWVEKIEEPKIFTRAECRVGTELLTEAEGIFVRVDAERARRLFGKKG